MFVGSLLVSLFSMILVLILPYERWSLFVIIGMFGEGGFTSAARMMVGYCYLLEFAPEKYLSTMTTIWCIHDSIPVTLMILFYEHVSKDWRYTIYWGTFVQTISLLSIIIFIPESPKWLYDQSKSE